MDRRGFLGRLTAAAAAFTAAVGGSGLARAATPPTAAAPARLRKLPGVAIAADTSRFEKSVGDAGREVVELLRQCRVTSLEWTSAVGELKRYRAVFEERDKSAPLTHLDTEAWKIIEAGYLTSVSVDAEADALDVTHLGDYRPTEVYKVRRSVTAEFIVRG